MKPRMKRIYLGHFDGYRTIRRMDDCRAPRDSTPLDKKRRRPKPTPGGSWKLGLTLAVVAIEFERAAPACYPRFKSVPFCDAGEELVALSCNPREAVRD